ELSALAGRLRQQPEQLRPRRVELFQLLAVHLQRHLPRSQRQRGPRRLERQPDRAEQPAPPLSNGGRIEDPSSILDLRFTYERLPLRKAARVLAPGALRRDRDPRRIDRPDAGGRPAGPRTRPPGGMFEPAEEPGTGGPAL